MLCKDSSNLCLQRTGLPCFEFAIALCPKSTSLSALPPDVRRGLPRRMLSETRWGLGPRYGLWPTILGKPEPAAKASVIVPVTASQSPAAHTAAKPRQTILGQSLAIDIDMLQSHDS